MRSSKAYPYMAQSCWFCRAIALACAFLASACAGSVSSDIYGDASDDVTVFSGINVITMANEDEVLTNRTLVVVNGVITYLAEREPVDAPPHAKIISAQGRYLIPGLADMHIHLGGEAELPLYIANGVTLVRNMWGDAETLALRDMVAAQKLVGPRIFTAGAIIDGKPKVWPQSVEVANAVEARAAVEKQKAEGYDFVKVYSRLSVEAFDAIAEAASDNDIPFAGHIPLAISVDHAMRSGMASMEHLYGLDRAMLMDGFDFGQSSISEEKIVIGRALNKGEVSNVEVFDSAKMKELAQLAHETGIWNTPTLIVLQNFALTGKQAEIQLQRPEAGSLPAGIREFWDPKNDIRRQHLSDEDFEALHAFFAGEIERVRELHLAGARLLAGTDAPNPYVYPGAALHEELALLVGAGLTPFEALQAATVNAYMFIGEAEVGGTIEVGKRADLILLAENPLENIENSRSIEGVFTHGVWFDNAALVQLLHSVNKNGRKSTNTDQRNN